MKIVKHILDNLGPGLIYGGFIRDTIVGRVFKDIDIWFKTVESANEFCTNLATNGFNLQLSKIEKDLDYEVDHYPFSKTQYTLCDGSDLGIFIDVVISSQFPVNDFEANTLVFSNIGICRYDGDCKKMLDILGDISSFRLRILPGLCLSIPTKSDCSKLKYIDKCRMKNFQGKGWDIYCGDTLLYRKVTHNTYDLKYTVNHTQTDSGLIINISHHY
jgi:hypothetical protein